MQRVEKIGGAMVVAMVVVAAWAWRVAPDIAPSIAGGAKRGFGETFAAFGVVPIAAIIVQAAYMIALRTEPRRDNLLLSFKATRAGWLGLLASLAACQIVLIMFAFGHMTKSQFQGWIVVAACVGQLITANVMPKTRSNHIFGVRTPWTMASNKSWELSNRLAGRLLTVHAIICLLCLAVLPPWLCAVLAVGGAVGCSLIAAAYSYVVWKNEPDRTPPQAT